MATLLLDHGADVNVKTKDGSTPLHNAETIEMARLLLDRGANVNKINNFRMTPLLVAVDSADAFRVSVTVGQTLKQKSQSIEESNTRYIESIKLISLLLDHGARVNVEVSSAGRASNNGVILSFAEDVSKLRQDGLSVKDIEAIKQLVISEVGKLKTANVLQELDARIAEERQKGSGGNAGAGGTCSKGFE